MNKTLKGAVIGYGFISSKGHVPAYLQRASAFNDVEIIAVQDICQERRELARSALPHAKIYTDFQNLLKNEAKNLDFVDISVPPYEHYKIASLALEHGLHVLCEKPLTITSSDAFELLEQAKKAKRVLFPCHNYKHAPVVKAINEVIKSGRIGKVRSVTLHTFRNTHAKGVPQWNTHWRRFNQWSGGGIAMDHGSHSFYLAFDWLKSYPLGITAKMDRLDHEKYDTEDNFSCVLTFPTGLAHMHLSWTAGTRKVIYTLQGEKGAIKVEDDDMEVSVMKETAMEDVAQGAVTWDIEKKSISSDWMDASHVGWFNSLFDEFKTAIADGDYAGHQAREALLCVEVINAAYLSARKKSREVSLAEKVLNSIENKEHTNGTNKNFASL